LDRLRAGAAGGGGGGAAGRVCCARRVGQGRDGRPAAGFAGRGVTPCSSRAACSTIASKTM